MPHPTLGENSEFKDIKNKGIVDTKLYLVRHLMNLQDSRGKISPERSTPKKYDKPGDGPRDIPDGHSSQNRSKGFRRRCSIPVFKQKHTEVLRTSDRALPERQGFARLRPD